MTSPQSGATSATSAGAGYTTQTGGTGYAPPPSPEEYAYAHNTAEPLGEHAMTDEGHPDVEGTSVGQLIGQVTTDLSTLMRQELELAKAEVRAEANKATTEIKAQTGKAGKGAGMLGGAGFGGYMVALFLSLALMWALASAIPTGWAALIVAAVWAVVAAVLFVMGRKQLKAVDFSRLKQVNPKPEQTVETLQQVPGALKPN
ncbi:phage holin family protein [Modestobacter sp. NPDC049651]|uniref:phage holin family protein n=1 Tax=unclassified Modestobacter TaxID=2643866 RepID=UPI0033EEB7F4